MLPSLASIDELAELIPDGIPVEDQLRAGRNLLSASTTVRFFASQPAGWTEDDGNLTFPVAIDVPDGIKTITLESAKRAFNNPTDLTGETRGDYAWSAPGGGNTYLTKTEKEIAASFAPEGTSSGVSTLTLQIDDRYRRALRPQRWPWSWQGDE